MIDAAARNQSTGSHASCENQKPNATSVSRPTKPPAFDATERNAVTGVGAPS